MNTQTDLSLAPAKPKQQTKDAGTLTPLVVFYFSTLYSIILPTNSIRM